MLWKMRMTVMMNMVVVVVVVDPIRHVRYFSASRSTLAVPANLPQVLSSLSQLLITV